MKNKYLFRPYLTFALELPTVWYRRERARKPRLKWHENCERKRGVRRNSEAFSQMTAVSSAAFESLRQFDTCSVSNAIERFNVRLRNEGFVSGALKCRFPQLSPMLGYAATARVRTSSAPMTGRCYFDRMDWWNWVASIPEPRVIILQDIDHTPGLGALMGGIHATIAQALNCAGCITNGAVRDLEAVEALGFPLFSRRVSVSHAYAHIVDFGGPVEVGGLAFQPGDLVHGDRNGVQIIPREIAAEVPGMALRIQRQEGDLIRFCRSDAFSLRELAVRMRSVSMDSVPPAPSLRP
jgi:4-hydroxy-4-methyl-2-oxoglutarate aldolase